MAKTPGPGKVKTRLGPICSPQESAALAEAALADTLDAVLGSAATRVVIALEGSPGDWIPAGADVIPQVRGGFAARLAAAWQRQDGPTLQIGMDTPQITADLLDRAMEALDGSPGGCVLGLADDGGWWALGMQRPEPRVFDGVPMSHPTTGMLQIRALRREVGPPTWLPALTDFDTAADVVTVAAQAPGSRLAGLSEALGLRDRLPHQAWLRDQSTGRLIALRADVWVADGTTEEHSLLSSLDGPVLDVGCGPGRHLEILADLGVPALGVDTSPVAVDAARTRGALALERSVFATIPGEGRYESAILLDGNIGIGGDPVSLLRRVAQVVSTGGTVLVETGPPGSGLWRGSVRLERDRAVSPPFPWAELGADAVSSVAAEAGLLAGEPFSREGRWFAVLRSSGLRSSGLSSGGLVGGLG